MKVYPQKSQQNDKKPVENGFYRIPRLVFKNRDFPANFKGLFDLKFCNVLSRYVKYPKILY